MQTIQRQTLSLAQEEDMLRIFAQTFSREPMFGFMLEGRADLEADTRWLAERKWSIMKNDYDIWTNPEETIQGYAWWLAPERRPARSLWAQLKAGYAGVPFKFGLRRFRRMLVCSEHELKMLKEALQRPTWVLDVITTAPAVQGQGLGRSLIEPIFAKADQAGVSCYVLTHNERNVQFYENRGFQMEKAERVCPGGPMAYGLRRG